MEPFNLEQYLREGMEDLVRDIMKRSFKNPKESAFLVKYGAAVKRAGKRRQQLEQQGEHVPSYLIASITTDCNLRCAGCYDRANRNPDAERGQLRAKEWGRIFTEAEEIGVSMILLAGGEPLMRRDIIDEATRHKNIVFPVFTNGTMVDDSYLSLVDQNRNIVPIVSIEGDERETDGRRGEGVYQKTREVMEQFKRRGILFGTSITVTKENLDTVTCEEFAESLSKTGCRVLLFVEYVPVDRRDLALGADEQALLAERVALLREKKSDMIYISFPGDEKEAEGCLAAGRGFFHINAAGGAEPCPFSPFSDTNLRDTPLRDALQSPLFVKLSASGMLDQEHVGGCVLFEQEAEVRSLLNSPSQ